MVRPILVPIPFTAVVRRAAACLGLAVGLAGCGDDTLRPRAVLYRPALHAVTFPDSVVTGDSIDLVVHFGVGGCKSPESFRLEAIGPRHLRASVLVRDVVGGLCPGNIGVASMTVRTPLREAGVWTVDVVGQDMATVSITVGSAPTRGGVHRFAIEPREPWLTVPSQVEVWWGDFSGPRETVSVDSLGRGEIMLPCAGGAERRRDIFVPGWGLSYRFVARPDDCTLPLRSRFFR